MKPYLRLAEAQSWVTLKELGANLSTMRYRGDATYTYPLNKILRVWVYNGVFWETQLVLKYSVIHFRHTVRIKWSLLEERRDFW